MDALHEAEGDRVKVRKLSQTLKWKGKRPRKGEIAAAGEASALFKVVGSEVVLATGAVAQ